jgi:hypothetical protein
MIIAQHPPRCQPLPRTHQILAISARAVVNPVSKYANYSGIFETTKTHKLCRATADDVLRFIKIHFGLAARYATYV